MLLPKLNITFTKDQAILLLGIYPKKLKTYVQTKTCTQIFTTAYNYQNQETTKMNSVGEWVSNKLVQLDS